jgi:hypothetical protein
MRNIVKWDSIALLLTFQLVYKYLLSITGRSEANFRTSKPRTVLFLQSPLLVVFASPFISVFCFFDRGIWEQVRIGCCCSWNDGGTKIQIGNQVAFIRCVLCDKASEDFGWWQKSPSVRQSDASNRKDQRLKSSSNVYRISMAPKFSNLMRGTRSF